MRLASFLAIAVWSQLDMITASTLKDVPEKSRTELRFENPFD
jgi:hypothetical protein